MPDDTSSSRTPNTEPPTDPGRVPEGPGKGGGDGSPARRYAGAIRFSWPPPGLEAVQGAFWQITASLALGSLILVLPLLFAVARSYPFYSLGGFGDAWWLLVFTSLFGILILFGALTGLFRFFRHGRKAGREGLTVDTLLRVAADRRRDMGFLLQGARIYRDLDEVDRERVARTRVAGALLFLASALWVAPGFFTGVILGARGLLGPGGLVALTLVPTALLALAGLGARGLEGTLLKEVHGRRSRDPWKVSEVQESARRWAREAAGAPGLGSAENGTGRFLLGSVLVVGLGVLLALPTFSLTLTSTVGPVLASVATPHFGATQERVAEAEVYRRYRLRRDSSITPLEAGEALHSLQQAGTGATQELFRDPVREYEGEFLPETTEEAMGIPAHEWPKGLFERVQGGLDPERMAFLGAIASHPALEEFDILSRAPAMDVLQARYELPFPPSVTMFSLPIPRFTTVREGGYAMLGKAGHQLANGDPEAAEETLRKLISAGFLLGDEGVTLIDNLIGFVLVRTGGVGLESFYLATGRTGEAEALAWVRETAERSVDLASADETWNDVEAALAQMPRTVQSPDAVRGLRWEYFVLLNGLTPCLNANRVVFGPEEGFSGFLDEAREVLVRYPSEEAYFELARQGWFGQISGRGPERLMGRVVELTLGGSGAPGSCAAFLGSLRW